MASARQFATRAIIIRSTRCRETDRILHVLSDIYGRMSLYARSTGKPGSRLSAACQFLCYSEFQLFRGKDLAVIDAAEVIESFAGLSDDMDRLRYASRCAELAYDCATENQPCEAVMKLLLNTLHVLACGLRPPLFSSRVFELRLLAETGFLPHLEGCVLCGASPGSPVVFSGQAGGLVCPRCRRRTDDGVPLTTGGIKALYHATRCEPACLYSFRVSEKVLTELGRISDLCIRQYIGKTYEKYEKSDQTDVCGRYGTRV